MFVLPTIRYWVVLVLVNAYCYRHATGSSGRNKLKKPTDINATNVNKIGIQSTTRHVLLKKRIDHKHSAHKSHGLLLEDSGRRPDKTEGSKGHKRQFLEHGDTPIAPHPFPVHEVFSKPLIHHERVHFVPKPFPVVSVQYVPRPVAVPVPVQVQPHVHVSHVHMPPHCK